MRSVPARKRVRVIVAGVLSIALVLPTGGCSLFAGSTDSVTVTASDPEAILYADGIQVGRGVAQAEVRSNESHVFTAIRGDRIGRAQTTTTLSVTGWLDVLFGCVLLVPLIGLASPGAFTVDRGSVLIVVPGE